MLRSRSIPRRGLNLDFAMWVFTRISGASLLVLGIIGLVGGLYMGARTQMDLTTLLRWTFFPNPNHVVNSNIPDVNLGWANLYWRIMQLLIVFFGATHGFNGLRVVLEDYIGSMLVRKTMRWIILVLWIAVLVVGILVVFIG